MTDSTPGRDPAAVDATDDRDGNQPEAQQMVTALVQLRSALQSARLPLELPEVAEMRKTRADMLDQLEDYMIPRVMTVDAPMLAVVGGSTGAGKSTLVNSLVGHRVTQPGVLRPTTRSPVLVHNPDDASWFGQERLLPDLERIGMHSDDPHALQLVPTYSVPAGLAILDAPDIDSVEEQNRVLAAQLLAAADLWLFVTSAARYADQVPWDYLRSAAERSAAVAIVLDRTSEHAVDTVAAHLARMLASRGLKDSPMFIVHEGPVNEEGLLPPEHVQEIRRWLESLAADADRRSQVVRQTLDGAIRTAAQRSYEVADAAAVQIDMLKRLRDDATRSYEQALGDISAASADGTLLKGEVLIRWQEFVGTGELLKALESKVGNWRDRITSMIKGRPVPVERVQVAVESGLETLIQEHAEAAAERAEASWQTTLAGQALLRDAGEDLGRASRDLRRRTERTVRDWQQSVLDMVRTEGANKRSTARFLALGVNGLSVALMIVVFAHTGGMLLGAEAGVAGGGALVGQKLLEAVFGDQAVRELAARARKDLERRVFEVLKAERARYVDLLDVLKIESDAPDNLREAVRRVDDIRFAESAPVQPPEPTGWQASAAAAAAESSAQTDQKGEPQ